MADKILILTEAGDNIGFGHFTRCKAIRDALKDTGVESKIIVDLKGDCNLTDYDHTSNWVEDNELVLSFFEMGYSTVLVDSYLAKAEYYVWLKEVFDKVHVLDDYNRIVYCADTVINPGIITDISNYSNQTARLFGGNDFVILRSAFRNAQKAVIRDSVKHIVISLGGDDYRNLIPNLIPRIMDIMVDCRISVVAGSPQLEAKIKQSFRSVHVYGLLSALEMCALFQECDVVVSASGQTLHELSSIGRPTISICIDSDQIPNHAYYCKIGFIRCGLKYQDLSLFKHELITLQDIDERNRRQNIGLSAINQEGVFNICEILRS